MKYEFYNNNNSGVISGAYHKDTQGVCKVYNGFENLSEDQYNFTLQNLLQTGLIPDSIKDILKKEEKAEDARITLEQGNGIKKLLTVYIPDQSMDSMAETFEPLTEIMSGLWNTEQPNLNVDQPTPTPTPTPTQQDEDNTPD